MFYSQANTGAVLSVRQMKWKTKKAAAGLRGHQRSTLLPLATEERNIVAYKVNENGDHSWMQKSDLVSSDMTEHFLPFFFCMCPSSYNPLPEIKLQRTCDGLDVPVLTGGQVQVVGILVWTEQNGGKHF